MDGCVFWRRGYVCICVNVSFPMQLELYHEVHMYWDMMEISGCIINEVIYLFICKYHYIYVSNIINLTIPFSSVVFVFYIISVHLQTIRKTCP